MRSALSSCMTGGMDEDTAPAVDEELLAEIPVHSTDVLTVLDTMGQIRYVSPSIERVFGYQQAELLDTQAGEFFHPDDRDRVLAAFEAVVSSDSHRVETAETVSQIEGGQLQQYKERYYSFPEALSREFGSGGTVYQRVVHIEKGEASHLCRLLFRLKLEIAVVSGNPMLVVAPVARRQQ